VKPRLKVVPLTEEDSRIWTRPTRYAYDGTFFMSRHQDRRDADLMLYLTGAHADIRPGTEDEYRYVWRLSHAFQGIPIVGNEDVA